MTVSRRKEMETTDPDDERQTDLRRVVADANERARVRVIEVGLIYLSSLALDLARSTGSLSPNP